MQTMRAGMIANQCIQEPGVSLVLWLDRSQDLSFNAWLCPLVMLAG